LFDAARLAFCQAFTAPRRHGQAMFETITIRYQGEEIAAHTGMTLLQALWESGHRLVEHVGCLGGVCGACAGTYVDPESGTTRPALACQLMVRDGLDFRFLAAPPLRAACRSTDLGCELPQVASHYPEVLRCRVCAACTQICPQEIDAMRCVTDTLQGMVEATAARALACVSCGLCAAVCEVGIAPNLVMTFVRRACAAREAATVPPPVTVGAVTDDVWQMLMVGTP
jgi:succinate dehydrogenase/fumarate reductase-like Fe-S protein